jgi:sporulation protein YlmC with PRC-barrel domain
VKRHRYVRLEQLLGKNVVAPDGAIVGRLEEVRADRKGDHHEVTEYLIGTGAMLERLAFVRRLFGRKVRMIVARWDQLDVTGGRHLQLLCSPSDLRIEHPHGP